VSSGDQQELAERPSADAGEPRHLLDELERIKERLELAIHGSTEGIWDWDIATDELYLSPRFKQVLGYEDLEVENVFATFESWLHPDDRARTVEAVRAHLEHRVPYDIEYRLRTKAGVFQWFRAQGEATWNRDGAPTRMAGSVIDITDRKRAEEERDRFFMLSQDLLCVAGFDGYFKRLNSSWRQCLGYEIEELLARPYIDFVHPDDRQATVGESARLSGGGIVLSFDNRYRHKDGSYRWLSWTATPVPTEGLIYASARDVTERREAEGELRRANDAAEIANKELEAFSYSVSHDLRAPLRGIDGFSQALIEDYGGTLDAGARHYLQRVRAATQRMSSLIDDMLTLSRISRTEMRLEAVDLSTLVRSIAQELQGREPERAATFVVPEGLEARGDQRLLRIALENLLANAWKFTRKQPQARIEFGRAAIDGKSPYFVRDNGAGFDMAHAGKFFGPFQRLHSVEEFEGTGIGLATVQRVVRRHGGRVWAEGAVGKGATFYFTLEKEECPTT